MEVIEDFYPKAQISRLKKTFRAEFGTAERKSWVDLGKETKNYSVLSPMN